MKPHCVSVKRQSGGEADKRVKNLPALLAPPRLAAADQAAIERARAKNDVVNSGLDRLDDFRQLRDRGREIGIGKKCDRRLGREQAGADGVAFAVILGETQNPRRHVGMVREKILRHLGGPVAGAVVDHNQLRRRTVILEVGEERAQVIGQAPGFVKGRDDDGEWRRIHA